MSESEPGHDVHTRLALLEKATEDNSQLLKTVLTKVGAIHEEVTKYKGIIGGVSLVVSALATMGLLLRDWIKTHIK